VKYWDLTGHILAIPLAQKVNQVLKWFWRYPAVLSSLLRILSSTREHLKLFGVAPVRLRCRFTRGVSSEYRLPFLKLFKYVAQTLFTWHFLAVEIEKQICKLFQFSENSMNGIFSSSKDSNASSEISLTLSSLLDLNSRTV
jgi:hypothetical protein